MTDDSKRLEKGRGATLNLEGRFAKDARTREDDGWGILDEPLAPLQTFVQAEAARTIISRNTSPDIPFRQSINPYRGCEHGCSYCVSEETPILCADGRRRPIKNLRVGDRIIGTERYGHYRRYVETTVLDHWRTIKPAYRIELADGTELIASGDHRFLTERGWTFVTGAECDTDRRPFLTTNNKLMGIGRFAEAPFFSADYKRGYLCGMIRGDGTLADEQALSRTRLYLEDFDIPTREFEFQRAVGDRRPLNAIRTNAGTRVARVRALVDWPNAISDDWRKGFLAGIFDAEGSHSGGVFRISNSDFQIVGHICSALARFELPYVLEPVIRRDGLKSLTVVRLTGGLPKVMRFFHLVAPAITRKLSIAGAAVKSDADLRVMSVEPLGKVMPMCDITTGTGDFIANGVVAHNCYARPSHAYMDLSPGMDFETRLFYKQDAAKLLAAEFRKPGYEVSPITVGANTDPYQPIERKYQVTRSILEVMREYRHPLTIITKGALVTRDIDILKELAADQLVQVFVSITSLDPEIKRTLEPRTAGPQARLRALRALADAGIPAGVMVAPIIPAITDHEIERIVAAAADAGAFTAGYVLLRLPYEVKHLFRAWLDAHYPQRAAHVMSLVQQMRGGRDNDPRFGSRMRGEGQFAELIRKRFHAACRKHGLGHERGIARRDPSRLRTDLFRAPPQAGDQFALFG